MKMLYTLRHAQTDHNLHKMVQGLGVDSSINETGRAQAKAFFDRYEHIRFDRVYTSSLKRTIQTVQPFIDAGVEHWVVPSLDEIGWGTLEGKTPSAEEHAQYQQLLMDWRDGKYESRMPNGESAVEIAERLEPFVEELRDCGQKTLLICTHGGIMAFLHAMLQAKSISAMYGVKHHNTGLSIYSQLGFNGHFELELANDTKHLEELL